MSSVIPSLIAIAMLIVVFTSMGSTVLRTLGQSTLMWDDRQGRVLHNVDTMIDGQTGLPSMTATSTIELTLENDGNMSLAEFSGWDVILEIQTNPGVAFPVLAYTASTTPATNEWTVEGIYVGASSTPLIAEKYGPGVLNPGEKMVARLNPSPSIVSDTYDRATFVTPDGVTAKVIFRVLPSIIYVVDATDALVYRYEKDGTFLGTDSLDAANANAMGITTNTSSFWTADLIDDQVYKYASGFSLSATTTLDSFNADSSGITTDAVNIWVADAKDPKVFEYDMNGVYVSKFSLTPQNRDTVGVATDGTNIWVADETDDLLYKYDLAGAPISQTGLTAANTDPSGVTTDGLNIWVVDVVDAAAYMYDMDGSYVSSFALTAANADPQGITIVPR